MNRAVVSFHLTGARPIRDDHLSAYCRCLDAEEKARLVSAWLRDALAPEDAATVLDPGTHRLQEEVRAWRPGLTDRQKSQLEFWASRLVADPDLAEIFDIITRRAGWQG
ncbi:MAG TPA: hypothetical protein PK490_14985 [Prosthecobacter sp.]|nr:hypothetical protein [Prosthecobacter sp.]HRK15583.1 hypothetical protein [Prosthecobacter sp.]